MITGLRPETFENLQTNAGAFLKNFDWTQYKTVDELETAVIEMLEAGGENVPGATIGDGSFQCTPTMRNIEANGMRYPIVGSTVIDMWTIRLTGTMKEVTPQNFKDAIATAEMKTEGAITTIKVKNEIEEGDYIPRLCWVGDTSKGLVLIELEYALNTNGATLTFTDRGEGSMPFEFQAHVKDMKDMKYAPATIVFFDQQAA